MATLLLQVAGGFLGGVFGPVGAAVGTAAGALAGNIIDNQLIASTRHYEGPRLDAMQPLAAEEGRPIPRIYGTMRASGTLIWATRFEEERRTERTGAKGGAAKGPKVTNYDYYGNFAFALCEGEIAGIRRIWADGRELDQTTVELRVYTGSEDQPPDPLIAARQGGGGTPAYRGTAYVVFERFPLDGYGNRIPQFQFEVLRPIGALERDIKAICVIPGSTEFGLAPYGVANVSQPGESQYANRHMTTAATDWHASLNELQALCPNLEHVALVVAWFGDDLDAARCRIRPLLSNVPPSSAPWSVCGVTSATADLVSTVDGRPAYGGTPDDRSVIEAIKDLKDRGLKVTFYPFVLMDIPPDNTLDDPYGAPAQAAYPWRGRVTVNPAPGEPGSPDGSATSDGIATSFLGAAQTTDFSVSGETAVYSGAASETGYRRFLLHCANLCRAAGGVDAFLVGTELRGLTTMRGAGNSFPFVAGMEALAGDARAMLGSQTKITYGADWSEYFGYQPQDGSGDVFFHLDTLWAHPAIDAVGIDNYWPLADWRDSDWDGANPDGALSPNDLAVMEAMTSAGEGYDWYYPTPADRDNRQRVAITDGSHGKPWVFRFKDIEGWWSNLHYNRIGGVEQTTPTLWVPGSKPVWLTETGSAAVDKGANQPNAFPDPKSSESAVPHFSNGGRDDLGPIRYARAQLGAWTKRAELPGAAVDPDRIYLWAWDARPFPAFPLDGDVWGDGANWSRGHWLNGRLGGAPVDALIETLLAEYGIEADASNCSGFLHGFVVSNISDARGALEALTRALAIRVHDRAGQLVFSNAAAAQVASFTATDMASLPERVRPARDETPRLVSVVTQDPLLDYQSVSGRAESETSRDAAHSVIALPAAAGQGFAETAARTVLDQSSQATATWRFQIPHQHLALDVGDVLNLDDGLTPERFSIARITDGAERTIEARRMPAHAPAPNRSALPVGQSAAVFTAGPPRSHLIDLPLATAAALPKDRLLAAAWSKPWRPVTLAISPAADGYEQRAFLAAAAKLGDVSAAGGPITPGRFGQGTWLRVLMRSGALSSASRAALLNGANAAAVLTSAGTWEVLQFEHAEETAPDEWLLTGLLRAQLGTEDAAQSGIVAGSPFVLLDDAVQPAGLKTAEIGLTLNFRFAPAGLPLETETSRFVSASGGTRALLPLSPVHLRHVATGGDGSVELSWIRRSRVDADNWEVADIQFGEEQELYQVEVLDGAGGIARTVQSATPVWTYAATDIAADLGDPMSGFDATVRQIGTGGVVGVAATLSVPSRN